MPLWIKANRFVFVDSNVPLKAIADNGSAAYPTARISFGCGPAIRRIHATQILTASRHQRNGGMFLPNRARRTVDREEGIDWVLGYAMEVEMRYTDSGWRAFTGYRTDVGRLTLAVPESGVHLLPPDNMKALEQLPRGEAVRRRAALLLAVP